MKTWPLTRINCSNKGITNIKGLELATGATSVNLSYNPGLKDFSPLSKLTQLKSVGVYYSTPSDLAWVKDLTNLTSLNINFGHVNVDTETTMLTDLSPLENLTKLTSLTVNYAYFPQSELKHIAGLKSLSYLSLSGNNLNDVSSLAGLTKLKTLYLHANKVKDFSVFEGGPITMLNTSRQVITGSPLYVPKNLADQSFTYQIDPKVEGIKNTSSPAKSFNSVDTTQAWSPWTIFALDNTKLAGVRLVDPQNTWYVNRPIRYVDFTQATPGAATVGTTYTFSPQLNFPQFIQGSAQAFSVNPDTPLPAGLNINPETGEISGTPTVAGVSKIEVIAKDGLGHLVKKTFELTIGQTPTTPATPTTPVTPTTPATPVTPATPPVAGDLTPGTALTPTPVTPAPETTAPVSPTPEAQNLPVATPPVKGDTALPNTGANSNMEADKTKMQLARTGSNVALSGAIAGLLLMAGLSMLVLPRRARAKN